MAVTAFRPLAGGTPLMHVKRTLALALAALLCLTSNSRALDKERIKKAVDAGVRFVRQSQNPTTGQWNYVETDRQFRPAYVYGMTSLAGLTLLVCNVPATDPAVQKAAAFVREGAARVVDTYSMSLCIMFLDKLGDRRDEDMIQGLAQRLIQGQLPGGAWTYDCPYIPFKETRRLEKGDQTHHQNGQPGDRRDQTRPAGPPGAPANMNDFMRRQWEQGAQHGRPPQGTGSWASPPFGGPAPGNGVGPAMNAHGDHSNTQFATMALWIARRHDVKADDSLARVSRYFRAEQNLDGGWSYIPGRGQVSTPSMTCAGLIGLAVGKGLKGKDNNNGKAKYDSRVAQGLSFLGRDQVIGYPASSRKGAQPRAIRPNDDTIGAYYFLWSLERTSVIYSLKTIHKKDWYTWGAELLLYNQNQDGSWRGKYGQYGPADTCFALMFLMRSNLVDDLTRALHGPSGAVERTLRPHGATGDEPATEPDDGLAGTEPGPAGAPATQPRTATGPSTSRPRPAPAPLDTGSSPLATRLAKLSLDQQRATLTRYRDGKGGQYTEALAGAIHNLNGDLREQVRDTLAERLARMTVGTLRAKLQDEDSEIRSAAALACGMKEEQGVVPDLIQALKDPDSRVPQAARVALKHLTREDFGPAPTATRSERAAVAEKWQRWWRRHKSDAGTE